MVVSIPPPWVDTAGVGVPEAGCQGGQSGQVHQGRGAVGSVVVLLRAGDTENIPRRAAVNLGGGRP